VPASATSGKTGKGYHIYFVVYVKGREDIKGNNGEHLGELKGSGHYPVLPPSVHHDGQIYEWVNPLKNGDL
jgi:hypothetical protein